MRLGLPGFRPALLWPFWNFFAGLGLAIGFPCFPYFSGKERNPCELRSPHFALSDMPTFLGKHPRRHTRLYDGKDYFTIYDFVKAHHHFNDAEWDGEPLEPEPREPRPAPGPVEPVPPSDPDPEPGPPRSRVKVKLADGKARNIQHMMCTSFWHPDGTPMSAQQFMEMLFGKLPEFFKDEAELRNLWSDPSTRKKLLEGLAEKGFGHEQLAEMQKIIDAEKSDLFDVLAHVGYAMPTLTREERAANAKTVISNRFSTKQQLFLDFVLSHYVSIGVDELDPEKLTPLLRLKYHNSIADAVADLGDPEGINKGFVGFQKFLYQEGPRV
jgi:type I restriction enzyme, R subunit